MQKFSETDQLGQPVLRKMSTLGSMVIAGLIAGCDVGGGPSAKIPDAELKAKWRDCQLNDNPSRLAVLACENYERECARRAKKGNALCR